ncbi:hypothetical protein M0R88_09705 [Halorussus gelatinilyticus]|uniref:Uncharacterized protein n=1 Tax=Halorussus gelatinilyticus TaxID=2937524 RepID=A0A8U0ICN4_9EURY|nr:hypothetical protein [Halorussus gelatinilyticus]UPV98806.1 hypothetical protein M0R88_09705 [Halorussus gelatinilyticus]
MTYRSESRGIMYTAPPSGDEEATDDEKAETEAPDAEAETPELDATTDANWTGTVPADD